MIDRSISGCFLIAHPAVYRIRVSGRIDPNWSERLQGMKVSNVEQESQATYSELSGVLSDQAALMGVLDFLYNCHIPLLSVECVSAEPREMDYSNNCRVSYSGKNDKEENK